MTGSHSPRPSRVDRAYPVPFRMERDVGPRRYHLTNRSDEQVDGVMLSLLGAGMMPASAPSTLLPGETLEVLISGVDLARSTILVVRWFRPSGDEYLWRASF